MSVFLSFLPIITILAALLLGARSIAAAGLGLATTFVAIAIAFPIEAGSVVPAIMRWMPILAEVLLIVGGGLLLSQVVGQSDGQTQLAEWISDRSGRGIGAVLLVVHGVTPFAESLTGFGVGITIAIPLLLHFGLPARKAAFLGLIGLCAVPWGSMGPGTLIAATMSDITFHDLGIASALFSVVTFVATGITAALTVRTSASVVRAAAQGALSGVVLTVAVLATNVLFGTPPAGALGGLAIIGLNLLRTRAAKQGKIPPAARRVLGAYAVLLGGVLVAEVVLNVAGLSDNWRYIASPALWLFIASFWYSGGLPKAGPAGRAFSSWLKVAPVTGLFILLGILMAVSGMATFLAHTLTNIGSAYLFVAPYVGAIGGFVTGSNSGANSMFAAAQAEAARALGVDVLYFIAAHNVAASFLLMASPSKVEMALQLAGETTSDDHRWLQSRVLFLAFVSVTLLAVLNCIVAAM